MRAVWIDVPQDFLAERHRLGHDKHDEIWEGVLHMVPPPSTMHGRRGFDLGAALQPIAARRGMSTYGDGTGIFDPHAAHTSYRIPDVVLVRPEHEQDHGLASAELVIELLSPHDEARAKFPFYAKVGVKEIWLIEPRSRSIEIHALVAGSYVRVVTDDVLRSPLLGITIELLQRPEGDRLRLRDSDQVSDV